MRNYIAEAVLWQRVEERLVHNNIPLAFLSVSFLLVNLPFIPEPPPLPLCHRPWHPCSLLRGKVSVPVSVNHREELGERKCREAGRGESGENLSCASMKGQFIRSCSGRQNILPQCFTDCLDEEWELTAQCRSQTRAGPGPRLQQHQPGTARCKHPWGGVEDQGHTGMRRVQ